MSAAADPICPNEGEHTPLPSSYTARQERYAELAKTHRQKRCPGCGLFTIWIPKEPADARP